MSTHPPRYHIPTHLNVPDKIDLPLFGMTVSLTIRQGICFLFGGSVVFNLWQQSLQMIGVVGWLAHWGGPFLLACATYVMAVHEVRGRHLETWALVGLHYLTHPKVFVWCSVLDEYLTERPDASAEETVTLMQDLDDEENDER
jgi:hypothetical protein